jgi:hypothetical protein
MRVVAPAKPPAAVTTTRRHRLLPRLPAGRRRLPREAAAPPLTRGARSTAAETRAIGVMTKLAEEPGGRPVDKFRAYYKRQAKTSLAELRRPYDMLLLKVLSLPRTATRPRPGHRRLPRGDLGSGGSAEIHR